MSQQESDKLPLIFDPEFRKQYVFEEPRQAVDRMLLGHRFACFGEYKSGWSDVSNAYKSGFVVQEGLITIVNPDPAAAIAFLQLDYFQYQFFVRDAFKQTERSEQRLIVFPRDPSTLNPNCFCDSDGVEHKKDPVLSFGLDLLKQVPGAAFKEGIMGEYKKFSGLFLPHQDFIQRELGEGAPVAEAGLTIFKVSLAKMTTHKVIHDLFKAPMLSADPAVRDGFKTILHRLIGWQDSLRTCRQGMLADGPA